MSTLDPAFAPENPSRGTHTADENVPAKNTEGSDAQRRAAAVKDTSLAAGEHVADVAKDEIHKVASETKKQVKDLYRETQTELADQAATQQKRVATGIRALGDELGSMAGSSEAQGVASDLAQQAATRAAGIADWLDQRDPGSLLNEVKEFARRRPGTFITIAAVTGVVAGRLTRSVIAEAKDSTDSDTADGTSTAPIAPVPVVSSAASDTAPIDPDISFPVTESPTFQGEGR